MNAFSSICLTKRKECSTEGGFNTKLMKRPRCRDDVKTKFLVDQMTISATFYEQLLCMKVLCKAFLYL